MKIQIIQLEPEDDHASARDKISQVKAPSALLVWPRRGRPLARRLDLELIARHARRRGIALGLVVFDPEIRSLAARLGLAVFDSVEGSPSPDSSPQAPDFRPPAPRDRGSIAELRQARDSSRPPIRQLPPRARQIAFGASIGTIVVLAMVLIPQASVIVRPDRSPFHGTVRLWIDPELDRGPVADRIPGQQSTVSVSGESRIETSGRTRLPSAPAAGEVIFKNLTDESIEIPEGTGLRAGELRFVTEAAATLGGEQGAEISVSVLAALPGRSGNVAAGAIDAVEGALGFLIKVSNPEPTSGGQDVLAGAVTPADLVSLRNSLELELLVQAARDLRAQLSLADELVPGSLRVVRVAQERFDRTAGAAAESLGLELTLEVEGLAFRRSEAQASIEARLPEQLPDRWQLIPGTLSFQPVEPELQQRDGAAIFGSFDVRADTAREVSFEQIRRQARGTRTARVAGELRSAFDLLQPPTVKTSPAWLPWLPFLEVQIEVLWPWETS